MLLGRAARATPRHAATGARGWRQRRALCSATARDAVVRRANEFMEATTRSATWPVFVELRHGDAGLFLIGTRHDDAKSCEVVKLALDHLKPDTTAIELDGKQLEHMRSRLREDPEDAEMRTLEFAVADRHPRRGKVIAIDQARSDLHTSIERGSSWPELVDAIMTMHLHLVFHELNGFYHPMEIDSVFGQCIRRHRDVYMAARLAALLRRDTGCAVAVVGKGHVPGLVHRPVSRSSTELRADLSEQERQAHSASTGHRSDRRDQRRALTSTISLLKDIAQMDKDVFHQVLPCARPARSLRQCRPRS